MHGSVIEFLKRSYSKFDLKARSILEVGSFNVNGSPRDAIGEGKIKSYTGVDMSSGPGVDVVCDASKIMDTFGVHAFDTVISTEMLEHARDWKTPVSQMKKVLCPGGLLLVTTRSPGFPYHPYPEDNWRYTKDHFKKIFSDMCIIDLENDPEAPGVFLSAIKPTPFFEIDLSEIEVIPMVNDQVRVIKISPYSNYSEYQRAQVETFGGFESDIPHWAAGQERFIKAWMADLPKDAVILDVACGDGVGLRTFHKLGFKNVVGVEFSPKKADRARLSGFPVHEFDMHDMRPFPSGHFDFIYSSHSLEHAWHPGEVLSEFRRILKPSGQVILVLPYPDVGELEKHCAKQIMGSDLNDDGATLATYFKANGFRVVKKAYDSFREVEIWMVLEI